MALRKQNEMKRNSVLLVVLIKEYLCTNINNCVTGRGKERKGGGRFYTLVIKSINQIV